jgi:large subunit ribosomal protein L35
MPKQKTNKAAKKRFKLTRTGKLMFKRSGIKHINTHMSASRKRRLRKNEGQVAEEHMDRTMQFFPYKKYAK